MILYGTWAAGTRSDDYRWAPSLEDHARLVHAINNRWGSGIGISNYAPSLRGDPAFREWMGQVERSGATPSTARALVEIKAATDVRHVLEASGFWRPSSSPTLRGRLRSARVSATTGCDSSSTVTTNSPPNS